MDRIHLRPPIGMVAIALAILSPLATGCARNLPLHLVLERTWTGFELEAVRQAIAEWNDKAGSRLRGENKTIIIEDGWTDDTFSIDDLSDDKHVLYRFDEPTKEYLTFSSCRISSMSGGSFATYDDILLATFTDPLPSFCREETYLEQNPRADYDAYVEKEGGPEVVHDNCLMELRYTVLHELGHFIGLLHYDARPSIMNFDEVRDLSVKHLTEADIDLFCLLYDCT